MALSMKQSSIGRPTLGVARRPARPVVCHAAKPESASRQVPVAIASVLAAMMVSGAFVPDDALAARSGGRAGGANFSSRRSSAPARSYNTAPRGRLFFVFTLVSVVFDVIRSVGGGSKKDKDKDDDSSGADVVHSAPFPMHLCYTFIAPFPMHLCYTFIAMRCRGTMTVRIDP
eukprot:gene4920-34690_t